MTKFLLDSDGQVVLAAGGYARVGWPDERHVVLITDSEEQVDVTALVLDDLNPFPAPKPLPWNTFLAKGDSPRTVSFRSTTDLGDHPLEEPSIELPEQLAFISLPGEPGAVGVTEPAYALWSFDFPTKTLRVTPQRWSMGADFDPGYTWPTVAARDPETRLIVAAGYRLPLMVLDEAGATILSTPET